MKPILGTARKVIGRLFILVGFLILCLIPLYFLLQMLGIARGGIDQFGVLGYLLILGTTFISGFAIIWFGMWISGDK